MSALAAPPDEYPIGPEGLEAVMDAALFLDQLVGHFAALADRATPGSHEYLDATRIAFDVEQHAGPLSFICLAHTGMEADELERHERGAP